MKRLILPLVTLASTLIFYQNCSKSQFASENTKLLSEVADPISNENISTDGTISEGNNQEFKPEAPMVKITAAAEELIIQSPKQIPDPNYQCPQSIDSKECKIPLLQEFRIIINLATGLTQLFERDFKQIKCLEKKDLSELQTLIKNQEICKHSIQKNNQDDIVCSSVIIEPYASLKIFNAEIKLGASTNGCGEGRVDFCSTKVSNQLRHFSKRLIEKKVLFNDEELCTDLTISN